MNCYVLISYVYVIYASFVSYQKAFDGVQRDKLIKVLHGIGPDDKDVRVIAYLYSKIL